MADLSLVEIRDLVREGLGNPAPDDLSDDKIDLYIRLALGNVQNNYLYEEEYTRWQTPLVIGQSEYEMEPEFDSFVHLSVTDREQNVWPLRAMDRAWYDMNLVETTGSRGFPERFLRENRNIILWPTPGTREEGLLLRATVMLTLGNLDQLPYHWQEIVVEGAVERGQFFREEYENAMQVYNIQTAKIRAMVPTRAKEQRNRRWAGVQVPRDWPDRRDTSDRRRAGSHGFDEF